MQAGRVFKTLYWIFFGAISLIALLLIVSSFPIPGNYKVMVVLSGSMEPTIKTGSVVAVKPSNNYQIGDVITFGEVSKTKTPVTHRIQEIKVVGGETVYITKGDANETPDLREIYKREIIGKVLLTIPYLGYAVSAAKTPFGFMLIIVVPAVVIIYDEIRKIIEEIKKKKQPKTE